MTMVLYDETGACFAQTLSEVIGWPQTSFGIEEEKPKHIKDYRQGNEIFDSSLLAFEANVRPQNENFPSQVSRTYLSGSPDQEIMRYGNYFPMPEGQDPPVFTNDGLNYSQGPTQSMTSIKNDVGTQHPKENVPPSAVRKEMQGYLNPYLGGITNNPQQQVQQEQGQQLQKSPLQDQQDNEMFPFIDDFLLATDSLLKVQPPKLTNKPISNSYAEKNTLMNSETWDSVLPPFISYKETSLSRPTSRTCSTSSNSRYLNTPVPNSISANQPFCTDGNFNFSFLGYEDARLQNNPIANGSEGSDSWSVPENRTPSTDPSNRDIPQHSFPNGLQNNEPQKDIQALMMPSGVSEPPTAKRRGRPPGSKNSVRTTKHSARSKKVPKNSKQTIPQHRLPLPDALYPGFVQQSYSRQPPEYPQQQVGYHQQPHGYHQKLPRYIQQQPGYRQQQPGYPQKQPEYPQQQPRCPQHPPGYLQQTAGYAPHFTQQSEYTQHRSQQPPAYSEQPGYNQQLSEYSQQLSGLKDKPYPYSEQPPNYPEQFFRFTQPLLEYAQQAQYLRQHPQYAHQISGYNQQLTSQVQKLRGFEEQYPIQSQQIPIQNQQMTGRSQQYSSETQQFFDQTQQLSGQAQQLSGHGHFFEEAQYLPLNRQSQYLPTALQRLPSPPQHLPSSLEHLPNLLEHLGNSQHFPSSKLSDFQNQPNPQTISEDLIPKTPKPVRTWHIPEVLRIAKSNSKFSEHVRSPKVYQAKHSENIPSMPIQQNSMTHSMITPGLPPVDETPVLRSLPKNLATDPQVQKNNQLQQLRSLPYDNVPESSSHQLSNIFQVPVTNSIAVATDSPSCLDYPVVETPATYLERRDWLLKSPEPLVIVSPKVTRKRKQIFRSSYKPHKGLKAAIRRYRARGIATRSPPPEIYLQDSTRIFLEEVHNDDDVEDEYYQDVENKQSSQDVASSRNLIPEEEMQEDKITSEDSTTASEEENASSSKQCVPSQQKHLPTALDIITGRWTRKGGFKKNEIHHQGLPNLQALLLKSEPHKIANQKQQYIQLNISIRENKQDIPKKT